MANCKEILNLIPLYADNVLAESEKDMVRRHIDSCKKCKQEFQFMTSIVSTAAELPEISVPDDFHKKLIAKAAVSARRKRTKRLSLYKQIGTVAAVAAVFALCVVSFGNMEKQPNIATNPDDYIVETPKASENPVSIIVKDEDTSEENRTDISKELSKEAVKFQKSISKKTTPSAEQKEDIDNTTPILKNPSTAEVAGSNTHPDISGATSGASAVMEEEIARYTVATVVVTENMSEQVTNILSSYEKDDIGYKVSDINTVIRSLAELGVTVEAKICDNIMNNYIIVED